MLPPNELLWLLAATAKGDEGAFERLYLATRGTVYGVLLRILQKPALAEEVLQETYAEVWRAAGAFNPRMDAPLAWVVARARSRAFDTLRQPIGPPGDADPRDIDDLPPTDDAPADGEGGERLRKLLTSIGELDAEERQTILLAYFNGWSREQLAGKLGHSPAAIAGLLRSGLLQMHERSKP